jgi:hypothetical protein
MCYDQISLHDRFAEYLRKFSHLMEYSASRNIDMKRVPIKNIFSKEGLFFNPNVDLDVVRTEEDIIHKKF